MKSFLPLTNNVLNLAIKTDNPPPKKKKNRGGFTEVLFVESDLMPR